MVLVSIWFEANNLHSVTFPIKTLILSGMWFVVAPRTSITKTHV